MQCALETQLITGLQRELIIVDVDILENAWQTQNYVIQILYS